MDNSQDPLRAARNHSGPFLAIEAIRLRTNYTAERTFFWRYIMEKSLYFDTNGSTPVHPEVIEAYLQSLRDTFGNAGAIHPEGKRAKEAINQARAAVARTIGAQPEEIYFTSGGTESNNWAMFSSAHCQHGKHIIVSAIEHKSVLRSAQHLMDEGYECTFLPVNQSGRVSVETLKAAIRQDTFLVCVMLANNETGVVQPVEEIGHFCRERGIQFHCDAVTGMGKIPVNVEEIQCDFLSLSGHKIYAPKGCGILYVRSGVNMEPLIFGCGQQSGLRSGTENTPAVVALGRACELLESGDLGASGSMSDLKERLWNGIEARFPMAKRNGSGFTLPNTLNVCYPDALGADMMAALGEQGISVSAGAAASNGTPSHVLTAMGFSDERARCSLRFSLGHFTTETSIDTLLAALETAYANTVIEHQKAC